MQQIDEQTPKPMKPKPKLRRGSRAAARRAIRRWAGLVGRFKAHGNPLAAEQLAANRVEQTRTTKRGNEFLCLACARWTHWDHGLAEDGPAGSCCDECANTLATLGH